MHARGTRSYLAAMLSLLSLSALSLLGLGLTGYAVFELAKPPGVR